MMGKLYDEIVEKVRKVLPDFIDFERRKIENGNDLGRTEVLLHRHELSRAARAAAISCLPRGGSALAAIIAENPGVLETEIDSAGFTSVRQLILDELASWVISSIQTSLDSIYDQQFEGLTMDEFVRTCREAGEIAGCGPFLSAVDDFDVDALGYHLDRVVCVLGARNRQGLSRRVEEICYYALAHPDKLRASRPSCLVG